MHLLVIQEYCQEQDGIVAKEEEALQKRNNFIAQAGINDTCNLCTRKG